MFAHVASVYVVAQCSTTGRVAVAVPHRRSSCGSKVQPGRQGQRAFRERRQGQSQNRLYTISIWKSVSNRCLETYPCRENENVGMFGSVETCTFPIPSSS
jgi:hypothetical protein